MFRQHFFCLELSPRWVCIWTIVREMKTTCVDSLWFLHYFWLLFRCDKASVFKNFIISIRWRRQKKTPLPWISIHHFSRQNTYMSIIFSNSTSIQWILRTDCQNKYKNLYVEIILWIKWRCFCYTNFWFLDLFLYCDGIKKF